MGYRVLTRPVNSILIANKIRRISYLLARLVNYVNAYVMPPSKIFFTIFLVLSNMIEHRFFRKGGGSDPHHPSLIRPLNRLIFKGGGKV